MNSLSFSFKKIKEELSELSRFPYCMNTPSSQQNELVGSYLACTVKLLVHNFLQGRLGEH